MSETKQQEDLETPTGKGTTWQWWLRDGFDNTSIQDSVEEFDPDDLTHKIVPGDIVEGSRFFGAVTLPQPKLTTSFHLGYIYIILLLGLIYTYHPECNHIEYTFYGF